MKHCKTADFEVREDCQENTSGVALFPYCSGSVWTITELKEMKCRHEAHI